MERLIININYNIIKKKLKYLNKNIKCLFYQIIKKKKKKQHLN